jgi:hypothetical protein
LSETKIKGVDSSSEEQYVKVDSDGTVHVKDNNVTKLNTDAGGNLRVVTQGGAGGTAQIDDSAFTVGTDAGTPAMGLYDDTATDTVDEGDVGAVRMDALRRLIVVDGGTPAAAPVYVNATNSGDTAVIAAPGSGALYIQRVLIINGGSAIVTANLQENGAATNYGPGDLAADGGGAVLDFGMRGWKLADTTGLDINCGTTCDLHVTVLQYISTS